MLTLLSMFFKKPVKSLWYRVFMNLARFHWQLSANNILVWLKEARCYHFQLIAISFPFHLLVVSWFWVLVYFRITVHIFDGWFRRKYYVVFSVERTQIIIFFFFPVSVGLLLMLFLHFQWWCLNFD